MGNIEFQKCPFPKQGSTWASLATLIQGCKWVSYIMSSKKTHTIYMYSEWHMDQPTRSKMILICPCSQDFLIWKMIVTRFKLFWHVIDKIFPCHFSFMIPPKNSTVLPVEILTLLISISISWTTDCVWSTTYGIQFAYYQWCAAAVKTFFLCSSMLVL